MPSKFKKKKISYQPRILYPNYHWSIRVKILFDIQSLKIFTADFLLKFLDDMRVINNKRIINWITK